MNPARAGFFFGGAVVMRYVERMNVHVTQFAEGLPRRGFTVGDVRRMTELGLFEPDERFELWGGEIVPMSPKSWRDQRLKNWIGRFRDIRGHHPQALRLRVRVPCRF